MNHSFIVGRTTRQIIVTRCNMMRCRHHLSHISQHTLTSLTNNISYLPTFSHTNHKSNSSTVVQPINIKCKQVVAWLHGNSVAQINQVTLYQAGLVLRWLTVHLSNGPGCLCEIFFVWLFHVLVLTKYCRECANKRLCWSFLTLTFLKNYNL